jgi:hypothetical protein
MASVLLSPDQAAVCDAAANWAKAAGVPLTSSGCVACLEESMSFCVACARWLQVLPDKLSREQAVVCDQLGLKA